MGAPLVVHVHEVLDGFSTRCLRRHVGLGLGLGSEFSVVSTGWVLRRRGSKVSDGFSGRWLRCHVDGVANSLLGLLGEGSAGTVMKFMMGLLQMAPSSRGKGSEGSEGHTMSRVRSKGQANLCVVLSQGAPVVVIFCAKSHFRFER